MAILILSSLYLLLTLPPLWRDTDGFNEIASTLAPMGAWGYLKHFGAPLTWEAYDLANYPYKPPFVVSETKDGLKVSAVTTHHGDAPAVA